MVKKLAVCLMSLALLGGAASAVELRMKYEPGQTRKMSVQLDVEAELEVGGSYPVKGTGKAGIGSEMALQVMSVDGDGIATIQQSVEDVTIKMDASADTPDGPKKWGAELNPNGGTWTADGNATPIPGDALKDIREQSWSVRMNELGAPVGMDINTTDLTEEEAEQARRMSESIGNLVGKSALLPEGNVEKGQTWEHILAVGDLTKDLVKDNPMLSVISQMGIPDLKTTYKLDDLSTAGDRETATISSKTEFAWTGGNIPLGVVNIMVNNLSIQGNTLSTLEVGEGYISRQTSDSRVTFDLTINSVFGPDGPATYEADGSLNVSSNVKYE